LEIHPQGPPVSLNVAATIAHAEAEALSVVDVVDATDAEDTVHIVDTMEAVDPETATKVSAPIVKLTAILQMHAGSGNAPRREETMEDTTQETTSAFVSSTGS
jgi:hypothetical protein